MNFKKFFASTTSMVLAATAVFNIAMVNTVSANADMLNDVEYQAAAQFAIDNGLTSATTIAGTNPAGAVTREQLAAITARFIDNVMPSLIPETLNPNCTFTDINQADSTLVNDIMTACQYNVMKGGNGTIQPKAQVTRAVLEVVFARMLDGMKDETMNPRYQAYRDYLLSEGVITKIVNGESMVNRYALFLMLFRLTEDSTSTDDGADLGDLCDGELGALLGDVCDDLSDDATDDTMDDATDDTTDDTMDDATDDTTDDVDTEVKSGTLNVSLDPSTPNGMSIPDTANNVKVMVFELAAGSEDINVDSITIEADGFTNNTSVESVYLRDASGRIITNTRGLDSDGMASLTIKGGLTVKANGSETLTLYLNAKGASGDQFKFRVADIDAIESSALTVNGSFPLVSDNFDAINYKSQTLEFDGVETAQATTSTSNELTVGQMDQEIASFTLEAGTVNDEDVVVESILLEAVDNNVADYFSNIEVRTSQATVDADLIVDQDTLLIVFPADFVIEDGETATLYVYADIIGGENNDIAQFELAEDSDLVAYEQDSGASVDVSYNQNAALDVKYTRGFKIIEGDSIITRSTNSPTSQFVAKDSSEVVIMEADANFTSEVYVKDLVLTLEVDNYGAAANVSDVIESVTLYEGSRKLDEYSFAGANDVALSANPQTANMTFAAYRNLEGVKTFRVAIETAQNAPADATVRVLLDAPTMFDDAEYVGTDNPATADINGSATSAVFTVKNTQINTVSRTDGFVNNDTIVASQDIHIGTFEISTNNVRDVVINSLEVSTSGATAANAPDFISTITIEYDGEREVKSFNNATETFTSLGMTIAKGDTQTVRLYATLNTQYATPGNATTPDLQFALDITDADALKENGSTTKLTVAGGQLPAAFTTAALEVTPGADITVAKISDNTPSATVIPVGANGMEVARFDVRSEKDAAQMQEVLFQTTQQAFDLGVQFAIFAEDGTQLTNYRGIVEETATATNTYYTHFALASSSYIDLAKDDTTSLMVYAKSNATIDALGKTNVPVNVEIIENIPGAPANVTARTKVVGKSNSADVTTDFFASAGSLVSPTHYLRRTNLNVELTQADVASATLTFSTANGKNAAISAFPIEVSSAGIDSMTVTKVEVNGSDRTYTLGGGGSTLNLNGVTYVILDTPTDISASGTTIKVTYTTVLDAAANTVDAKVRIPEVAAAATLSTMGNAPAAPAAGVVRSDKAVSSTTVGNGNWFTGYEVIGLPTATIDIQ